MLNSQSKTALKRVLASLLGIAQTRLELAGLELAQSGRNALSTLIWALVMVFAVALCSLMLCAAVLVLAWDSYRVLAVLGCAGFYVMLAAFAYWKMRVMLAEQGPLLEATIAELGKDRQAVLEASEEGQSR